MKPTSPGNHPDKSLNECKEFSPVETPLNEDVTPDMCGDDGDGSLNSVSGLMDEGWLDENCEYLEEQEGKHALCDPLQTGSILNDLRNPDRNTVYRYAKGLRGCDRAIKDMFSNIVVLDADGKPYPVPIIWGSQERAVAAIMFDNVRKDNSLVVDRIRLPMLSVHQSDLQFNNERFTYHQATNWMRDPRLTLATRDRLGQTIETAKPGFTTQEFKPRDTVFGMARGVPIDLGYTLMAWTLYLEDMNQIVEQIIPKFSPVAYIRVRGVQWETVVKLESTANNLETEPGDQSLRVIKYQFNLKAETYIPQPIKRRKAVLDMRTNFFNTIDEEEITEVMDRLQDTVEELE